MLFSCLLDISNQMPHSGSTSNVHTETIPLLNFLTKWRSPLCTQVPRLGFWTSTFTPPSQILPWPFDPIPDLYTFLHRHHPHQPSPGALNSSNTLSTSRCAQSPPPTAWVVFLQLKSMALHCREDEVQSLQSFMMGPHYSPQHIILLLWKCFQVLQCTCSLSLLPLSLYLLPEMPCILHLLLSYFSCRIYWGCHPSRGPSLMLHTILQVWIRDFYLLP